MKCGYCEDPILKFQEYKTRMDREGNEIKYHEGCYKIILDNIAEKVKENRGKDKMKYFIVWGDYDHDDVMQIEDAKVAEEEITKIQAKIDLEDNYGTYLTMVIKGKEVEYKTVEVAKKCVLKSPDWGKD